MADLRKGEVLGERFVVVGVLGHGGMATVYLVEDQLRGEPVALKVLHGHLARSASMRARLRREVRAAGRLRHPNALVAWDLHELDGTLAVSMPLHPGRTLSEYVERHGPLTGPALQKLASQLAGVLREAHATGIVHRDVTPTNVMVDDQGDAVLTDFGLARFTDQGTATGTGALGTAGYAAPEVYAGTRSDPRSDLYSLGAVMYQAATGAAPFAAPDPMGVLRRQLDDDRTPLAEARPDLPRHLTLLVDRLLDADPEARPQGAAEVLDALESRKVPAPATPQRAPQLPAPRHHLPPGEWTVVVDEQRSDRERRRRLRQRLRRRPTRFETDVEKAVDGVKRWVMADLLGVEPSRPPEERLATAVAREADLPPDALTVPSAMFERRFRLVESVADVSARRLARAAESEGFQARAIPVRGLSEERGDDSARRALVFFALGLLALAGLAAGLAMSLYAGGAVNVVLPDGMPWIFFAVFVFPIIAITRRRRRGRSGRELPLAFDNDLRFHLSPDSDLVLPPLPGTVEAEAQVAAPAKAAPATSSAPPAPKAGHAAVLDRAGSQLAALAEAIEGAKERLPEVALRDLRGTLGDLRQQVDDLGRRATALQAELAALDDASAASAVDRIETRLERLRTLAAAGRSDGAAEIPRLEQSLLAHRAVLEQAEHLEGRLTLVVAQLLETGAAAARARMELVDEPEPARSAEDLLGRLREQTLNARQAIAELDRPAGAPLPREPLGEAARRRPKKVEERS